jgi:CheY-like chemotaxis protein
MDAQNPLRVLVVEDNADTAEALRCLLADCGFYVAVAHTTRDGLKTARQMEPHIVLCDIGLPDGDGYSVGSQLRQSTCNHARLIAVTGHAEPIDRQRALAAGFDQHLAKPVDPQTLLRELEVTL